MQTSNDIPFFDLGPSHAALGDQLDGLWQDALRSGEFVGGPAVLDFEREWAQVCGVDQAVSVANGTDAVELALRAMDVGVGDEVIMPGNTFIATAHAAVAAGATVVFADVQQESLLMNAALVEPLISPRTRAIVVVHLYGQAVDMDEIKRLADDHGLALVEDCAQAHGARWRDRPVGSFGDAGCFSFYPSKNLGAMGDGGAVVTRDRKVAERVRQLADHGRSAGARWTHLVPGRNSRLDALQARVLSAKLPHLDRWNGERRAASGLYARQLSSVPGVQLLRAPDRSTSVHHLEVVRVVNRATVAARLSATGVGTSVHYPVPCHLQPSMRLRSRRTRPVLPVVEEAAGQVLSLPMFPGITAGQVGRVCSALIDAIGADAADQREVASS